MQINITGHHLELSPALNDYVKTKMQRIQRHFDHVVDAHFVLGTERQVFRAEANVHVTGSTVHATSEHEDMYAAIDLMFDKLDRQVTRHKEKLTDHHARDSVPKG